MVATDVTLTGQADVSGVAELAVTPYRRQTWTVSQVSIEAPDVSASATAGLYRDDFLISPLVPGGDAASGDPPVILRPGERLRVVWRNLDAGDRVRAIVMYDDGNPA